MRTPRPVNIPHNAQALFTDAEYEVALLIYLNQQRAAQACRRVRYIVCKTFEANGRYAGHAYFAGLSIDCTARYSIYRDEAEPLTAEQAKHVAEITGGKVEAK